jgi:hypothetical protein
MALRTFEESDSEYELAQQRPPSKRLIRQILDTLRYPNALLVVAALTIKPWFQSKFADDQILRNREWKSGQPVLLIGLWEKGELRADVSRLLKLARKQGAYVVGVNTSRLSNPTSGEDLFDLYIERFNYGRDFGSYKAGILRIQKQIGLSNVPRMLLLNDSVFYLEKETPAFLEKLLSSKIDVLGATENFEIRRHLGSFAISIGNSVLSNPKFLNFWQKYRLSDLRTRVIRKGEMNLTKVLEKCATSDNQFDAIYTVKSVSHFLRADAKNIDTALTLTIHSRNHWRKLTMRQVLEAWRQRNLYTVTNQNSGGYINTDSSLDTVSAPTTLVAAQKELTRLYPSLDKRAVAAEVKELTVGALLLTCVSGSQVHQNGLLFQHLGSPLVKLDVIYRGTWSYEDTEKLMTSVSESDRTELARLLYSRAYGEDVLRGWRRAAFMRGII